MRKSARGFTLIELLVVIGILAVLLAIVLIAINPARQFAQANNTKRRSDVNAILNGIHQFMADNRGTPPGTIPNAAADIGSDTVNGEVDICADLVTQYLAALPQDPQSNNGAPITDCSVAYNSGYQVSQSASDNRITVAASGAELGEVITVTR